jgi:thiamine kinase-like enzyme
LILIPPGVIRKKVTSPSYGERLIKQAEKQIDFVNLNKSSFKSPKVYNIKREFPQFFDMEYVPGSSFNEYLKFASSSDVDLVLNSIFEFLDLQFSNSKLLEANEVILNKLRNLRIKSNYRTLVDRLIEICTKQKIIIPNSNCHGDLTLANMLFKDKHVYLIDFLDSYLDSVLIDLAKLKQDLYHYWSPILSGETQLRTYNICDYMWEKLENRYKIELLNPSFAIIECINLIRIEPYLNGEFQRNLLDEMIRRVDAY